MPELYRAPLTFRPGKGPTKGPTMGPPTRPAGQRTPHHGPLEPAPAPQHPARDNSQTPEVEAVPPGTESRRLHNVDGDVEAIADPPVLV